MPLPSVFDEIDRLFDELVRRPWGRLSQSVRPAELHKVEDGWVIEIPAEGLRAADLRVEVHGRRLTVDGYRRQERGGGTRHWREVAMHRTILLPGDADPDHIDATVNDTHLTIHVRRRKG